MAFYNKCGRLNMFENLFLWITVGGLSGLLIYLIFPTKKEYFVGTVFAGIAGAFFGGTVYSLLRIGTYSVAIDPVAFLMSIVGALAILRLVVKLQI